VRPTTRRGVRPLLSHLVLDDEGLSFTAPPEDAERVVDLLLAGRRIWSFRVSATGPDPSGEAHRRRLRWPRPLRPYLSGTGTIGLRPVDGGPDVLTAAARFGDGNEPLRFDDRHGIGLVINKYGRIGHALADYDPGMVQRLLDNLDRIRAVLAELRPDLPVYVIGGTLLGPYRDGRIMPHDDDADLGYLSAHSHPADVVREAFQLGRILRQAGFEVLRASAGHVQVHFSHEGRPDAYVDLFTGFIDEQGWLEHTFAIRVRATRDQVVPTLLIDVEGRPEPAPRQPELLLEGNYGPGWRVPDPSYQLDVPRTMQDRFWGWFSDYGMDRGPWEDFYRYDIEGARVPLGSAPSDYARWLAARIPAGSRVLELGTGRGHDALWLAGQGFDVEALDYVRWPMRAASAAAEERGAGARFRVLNLYDLRRVIALGAELAARREPLVVYARGLLGSHWDTGRPILLRGLSMLLRSGGQAHLDVPRSSLMPVPGTGIPMHRAVPVETLRAEMTAYGLRIDEVHDADEVVEHTPWETGTDPLPTTRMVVTWQRPVR
jgi:SAM-dependent methyltransferase